MHLYYVKFPFGAWYYFYEACSHWCFWLLPTDFHHCEVFYLMNILACIYLFCYWWCWGYWIVPLGIFITYISVHFKESFVFSGDGRWYKDTENKLKTAGEQSCKRGMTAIFSFRSKVKQETAKQTGRRGRPKHFPVQSIPERLAWFQRGHATAEGWSHCTILSGKDILKFLKSSVRGRCERQKPHVADAQKKETPRKCFFSVHTSQLFGYPRGEKMSTKQPESPAQASWDCTLKPGLPVSTSSWQDLKNWVRTEIFSKEKNLFSHSVKWNTDPGFLKHISPQEGLHFCVLTRQKAT